MRKRNGFSLVEMLVVTGILLILIAVLLPVLSKVRRQSQLATERLDLQTITTGLEAYRADFGVYPSNVSLPGWDPNGGSVPPHFMSLAVALIGPGNLASNSGNAGDGADGFGFRADVQVVNTTAQGSSGSNTVTVQQDFNSFLPGNPGSAGPPVVLPTSGVSWIAIDPGLPNEEDIPVTLVNGSTTIVPGATGPFTLTLLTAMTQSHSGEPAVLKTATGKLWGPYIQADRYKIYWYTNSPTGQLFATENSINWGLAQPLMLDRFGGPVQYFPRYGAISNRVGSFSRFTPTPPVTTTIVAGPLLGDSAPSTGTVSGSDYSMFDINDGTLNVNATATPPVDETMAFKWMLGDDDVNNVIASPETLRFTGGFVLISAGPDTASNPLGGSLPYFSRFCNLADPTLATHPNLWDKAFRDSGNVYNFDRY